MRGTRSACGSGFWKMCSKRDILLPLLCCFLTLFGCASAAQDRFYAGETVTPADIASMRENAFGSAEETTQEQEWKTDSTGEKICYWTGSGSVYHASKNCPSLSRAKGILSGSVSQAETAGIRRACSRCAREVSDSD